MSQVPFYLVTGFLGSGKTTFLKKVLKEHEGAKVAIIQNEFAPANIDGADLKNDGGNFQILEINNGSVFCVCLLNNFINSLTAFVDEHQPDMIFLEASGLSDPIAVAQMLDFKDLKERLYLAKVWTIVDSSAFLKQQKLVKRLQHQVRIGDTIILNKTDLCSDIELRELEQEIHKLNPFAEIIQSQYCVVPIILPEVGEETNTKKNMEQNNQFESCGRPDIGVGVLKTTKAISKELLMSFIDNYSKKTIRMKGFAKLTSGDFVAVQSSYGHFELREIENYSGPTEIIAMGDGFNLREFSRVYREFAE